MSFTSRFRRFRRQRITQLQALGSGGVDFFLMTKASQKGAQQAHKPTVQFVASGSQDSEWDDESDSDGSGYSGATSGQQGSRKLDNQVGTTAGSSGVSGDGPEEGTSHESHVYSTAEGSGRALRPRK